MWSKHLPDGTPVIQENPYELAQSMASARRGTSQSIPNGGSTTITFQDTEYDTDTMWIVGDPSKLTVKTPGVYRIQFNTEVDGNVDYFSLTKNGAAFARFSVEENMAHFSIDQSCSVSDYFQIVAYNTTGAGRNTYHAIGYTRFQMTRVNPGIATATVVAAASSVPAGTVLPYAGAAAPSGFVMADGTSYTTVAQPILFAAIGYQYGGSGANFNVPDLRQRVAVGKHSSGTFVTLGATGGAETHTLTTAQMPAHDHGGGSHNHAAIQRWGGSGGSLDGYPGYNPASTDLGSTTSGLSASGNIITSQGSGSAHNNLQPYIVLNHIIKT